MPAMLHSLSKLTYSVLARFVLTGGLLLVSAAPTNAQTRQEHSATNLSWARFRGANGSGYVAEGKIPDSWDEGDYAWAIDLPAEGIGSPVVANGKVFLLAADATLNQRHVLAYDLFSGKLLWDKTFAFEPHHQHKRNRFASSTPCCDNRHVYVAWSQPDHTNVVCLTHTGELVWEQY